MHAAFVALIPLFVVACSPQPLTTEQLYGRTVDARVSAAPDAAAVDAFVRLDTASPSVFGVLSGVVRDRCSGEPINALVGIANQHMCSFQGKGGFFFTNLPTAITLTLAAGAPGYRAFSKELTIEPNGTPFDIALDRLNETNSDTCDAAKPPTPVCSCLLPGCLP